MFSHFFIDRPIFSVVICLVIPSPGLVAMVTLPIAQYPQVTPIQIQVTATYPGANATLVAQNVGAPIEQQVNGANNMIYMSSTSSSTGNYTLTVYFTIDTDPALAQVDVQNRVSQAMALLPQSVQAAGGGRGQQKTNTFLMVLAFFSPDESATTRTPSPTTPTSRSSARSTASTGPTRRRSSASPNTPCASGSSPTAWRSSASPPPTSPTWSSSRISSSRSGASATPRRLTRSRRPFPVTTGTITEPSQFDNMILRADEPGRGAGAGQGRRLRRARGPELRPAHRVTRASRRP